MENSIVIHRSPADEVLNMSQYSQEEQSKLSKIAGEMEVVLGYETAKEMIRALSLMDSDSLLELRAQYDIFAS